MSSPSPIPLLFKEAPLAQVVLSTQRQTAEGDPQVLSSIGLLLSAVCGTARTGRKPRIKTFFIKGILRKSCQFVDILYMYKPDYYHLTNPQGSTQEAVNFKRYCSLSAFSLIHCINPHLLTYPDLMPSPSGCSVFGCQGQYYPHWCPLHTYWSEVWRGRWTGAMCELTETGWSLGCWRWLESENADGLFGWRS